MASPEGLDPPVASVISESVIQVKWKAPRKPNGVLKEFKLYRLIQNVQKLVYTGLNVSFTDSGLDPFTGYRYIIEACTTECALAEMRSFVYTRQSAPEGVIPPDLEPINATTIRVTWSEPQKPNGIIISYNVSRVVNSTASVLLNPGDSGMGKSLIVTNLKPYTNYTFQIVVCTKEGCTASSLVSVRTLPAAPEGVHPPSLLIQGARIIEARWTNPDVLNGVILYYLLYRGNLLVYNGTANCSKDLEGKDDCIFKDTNLEPVTTYHYTLNATTAGGSTRSAVASATTPESSPEGIPKPKLTPRSDKEIFAEWNEPSKPNGNLTNYSILVNGREHFSALNRSLLISGLKPYTFYAVRVKACTDKGCGIGDPQYVYTLEAPPSGQGPPTVTAREWNIVAISWKPPTTPNGIITRYEVYRRLDNGAFLQVCGTSKTSCLNSGLLGYTQYFYRIRSINSVGYNEGPWTGVRTWEGPPSGIRQPIVNIINSTAASVSWQAASQPNGIVTNYEVNIKEEFQNPDNTNITIAARVPSNVFNLTVNSLKPYTDYQFQIAAINNRSKGVSPWTSAKTRQAPPAKLQPLQADKMSDGKSIRIFWDKPGQPNGPISHYKLYKDGTRMYSGTAREYTVRKLVPFTSYEFQLEACTIAGCTKGPVQVIYTAQIKPVGQAPPMSSFVNESVVVLQWKSPAVPNGNIERYDVIRRESEINRRRRRAVGSETVIHSTSETNKTDYQYVDIGLKPYTKYEYKVRVVNSGGAADSDWLVVQTAQAPPTAFDGPKVIQLTAYSLNVTWKEPSEPNGIIRYYFVERNGTVVHKGLQMSFLDQGLEPNTIYSYTVTCCTGGGCTHSSPADQRTADAAPADVYPPELEALSEIAVKISWRIPGKPNGIITSYMVYEYGNSQTLYNGLHMTVTVTGKQPYTQYTFLISACTKAGCTKSPKASIRTLEAAPENMAPPVATVAGSRLIRVEWKKPQKPNGIILYYLLERNGSQVYNGSDMRFDDHTVAPYTVYAYTVTAVNSAGRVPSAAGFSAPTHPGSPDNVSTPVLEVLTLSTIKVTWDKPVKPNGVILKYSVVYKDDQHSTTTKDAGLNRVMTLQGLMPYTVYEVWITACTNQGCSTGEASKARTLEGTPEGQRPPDYPTAHITARSLLVTWTEPQKPNGFILTFELYRRQVLRPANQAVSPGKEVSIFNTTNGTQLAYSDTNVRPYSEYEYRVISGNSVGRVSSPWSVVKTPSAPPEGLQLPQVIEPFMDKLQVLIKPPSVPNGEVRNYVLEVSGRNDSTGLEVRRLVTGLKPFTYYLLRVYVCTDGGCALSPVVNQSTTEAPPQNFDSPRIIELTSRSVTLKWDVPSKPNGVIIRWVKHLTLHCIAFHSGVSKKHAIHLLTKTVVYFCALLCVFYLGLIYRSQFKAFQVVLSCTFSHKSTVARSLNSAAD